jgi:hypothetical protein
MKIGGGVVSSRRTDGAVKVGSCLVLRARRTV